MLNMLGVVVSRKIVYVIDLEQQELGLSSAVELTRFARRARAPALLWKRCLYEHQDERV